MPACVAVNSNQLVEALNSSWVGVAVDGYPLWWDPNLEKKIARCAKNNTLLAFTFAIGKPQLPFS